MAASMARNFFKRTLIVINSIIALLFLLSCLAPYFNPSTWWFMGFLGLMFPYLAVLLIFSVIFWWVIKPVLSIISIITLLAGFKQFSVLVAINTNESYKVKKDTSQIRILDWNIRSFHGLSNKRDKEKIDRISIAQAINSRNPDVVCLQEFNHSNTSDNLSLFTQKYPYHFFSKDFETGNYGYVAGSIIFSKHPILHTGKVQYPGRNAESLIYADILAPHGVIRVFTTHLQSFRFNQNDYEGIDKIKKTQDEALHASKTLVQKMKLAFIKRGEQAKIVRATLDKSPYPSVICGDFNDVPNSYTYFHIKKDWLDPFLKKSLGIGRTFMGVAPTLRIDYILADKRFNIHQFDMVDEDLSDHLMLVTDLSVTK
jgi:endonuclease/exonuclease/phosphatase family metal-dependent hydrolase